MQGENFAGRSRAWQLGQSGATMVEHAIVLPIFVLFLLVCVDTLRATYSALSTQFVVERVLRDLAVSTANTSDSGYKSGATVEGEVIAKAASFGVQIPSGATSLCPVSAYPCPNVLNPGQALELIALRVALPISLYSFGGRTVLTVETLNIARREPA